MKRYDCENSFLGGSMKLDDDGDYVQWDDVQPLIEACKVALDQCERTKHDDMTFAINALRAALAAAQEPAAS
jgi:prephenate dehydrogenase